MSTTLLSKIVGEPLDTYKCILAKDVFTEEYSCKIIKGHRNKKRFLKFLDIYLSVFLENNLYIELNFMRYNINKRRVKKEK